MRFDEYVALCLYGSDGFYTSGRGSAGRRGGDFITSPEVGPLFGAVVGRWLDSVWRDAGEPSSFRVFDLGSGPGTLPQAILRSEPTCGDALELAAVDIASGNELPEDLTGVTIIANELLDNIPFRWLRDDTEAHVEGGELTWLPSDAAEVVGDQPLVEQAGLLVQNLLDRGAQTLLMFDYGALTTNELTKRGDWLRCYRGHQRNDDPLAQPGLWDITTDIPIDQLPTPSAISTQVDFLRRNGVDEMVQEGRDYWHANAARPDLRAMEMRSRINEAAALTDPAGLGGFWAMEWRL